MNKSLRIIFLGTPDFAVPSLDILHKNNFNIVAVVTAPDKPSGRGLQVHESAVKKYAVEHQLPVLQPVKLKDPVFIEKLRSFQADIQVVVAFRMLPEIVWNMPPLGTVNLHASLLPQYRGAAPINWAIMNGEKETGVTTFRLQHEIDTGEMIDQKRVPIGDNETAGDLHDKLMREGALLLLKTVQSISEKNFRLIPQKSISMPGKINPAPKIFKEDCHIQWNNDLFQIYNLIRGLSPYPTAWTTLNGKQLKVFSARKNAVPDPSSPGRAETDHKTYLRIACKNGWLDLTDVQLEGKRRMAIREFLRGFREEPVIKTNHGREAEL